MYRQMVVEDEVFVRVGLENAIPWEDYQIKIVASAQNGKEALQLYYEHRPHIIITDIKMPIMDGIEMIKEIRKTDQDVKFIILTCMEDFNMARQAVQYSVSYYLTKYDIDIEDLRDKIISLCKTISVSSEEPIASKILSSNLNMTDPHNENERYDIFSLLKSGQIPIGATYGVAEIVLKASSQALPDKVYLQNMITELVKSQKHCGLLSFRDYNLEILYFNSENEVQEDKHYELFISSIKYLIKMLKIYSEVLSYAVIGDFHSDITLLQGEFSKIDNSRYLVYYMPQETMFLCKTDYASQIKKAIFEGTNEINQFYKDNFGEEYSEDFCGYVNKFDEIDFSDTATVGTLIVGWVQLFFVILHLLKEMTSQYITNINEAILNAISFEAALKVLLEVMHSTGEEREQKVSFEMMKAVNYIQTHLDENPTLPIVAEYVNFSTGYLSYMFKKELNMSFTDFVSKLRIKKAKLMLSQSDKKLYEIAAQTGWYDQSYFVKMFKRFVGMTPNAYRKAHRADMSDKEEGEGF